MTSKNKNVWFDCYNKHWNVFTETSCFDKVKTNLPYIGNFKQYVIQNIASITKKSFMTEYA